MHILFRLLIILEIIQLTSCSRPKETTIYFQPLGSFTEKEALILQKDFSEKFNILVSEKINFKILKPVALPQNCFNEKRTRYRSEKLLDYLRTIDIPNNSTIIGLTHKDISTSAHNVADYGILGQATIGGTVCIVSDFRVKNKRNLWKVASHEFIHAFYDYMHCPEDDPTCIIKDAKGKENLDRKYHLCNTCKNNLR